MQTDPESLEKARQGMKYVNRGMLLMWRLGLGRDVNALPGLVGRIMVLGHKGRRSGKRHYNPVNYVIVDGDVYCMAGFGPVSDWYRNILADPQVQVWLPDGWWEGQAEEINATENRLPLIRQLMVASGFVARLLGMDPKTISDAELAAVTADYRLVHIRRTAARTGPGGPGDLAWIWPYAAMILLGLLLVRRRS